MRICRWQFRPAFSIKSSVFQAKWSHILRGSATSELSAITKAIERRKNSERTHSTPFGRFLYCHCMTKDVKNDWNGNVLSLRSLRSSLHQWWLSRLWFHQKYPYRGSSYYKTGAYCAFFKSRSLGHVWPINYVKCFCLCAWKILGEKWASQFFAEKHSNTVEALESGHPQSQKRCL